MSEELEKLLLDVSLRQLNEDSKSKILEPHYRTFFKYEERVKLSDYGDIFYNKKLKLLRRYNDYEKLDYLKEDVSLCGEVEAIPPLPENLQNGDIVEYVLNCSKDFYTMEYDYDSYFIKVSREDYDEYLKTFKKGV